MWCLFFHCLILISSFVASGGQCFEIVAFSGYFHLYFHSYFYYNVEREWT